MKAKGFLRKIMYSSDIGFIVMLFFYKIFIYFFFRMVSDENKVKQQFKKYQGYKLDLLDPKTMNEKMQWLKLNDHRSIQSLYADKYRVRVWMAKKYGAESLVPLEFVTTDYKKITPDNLPDYPVIIKPNHGSGWYYIVTDKQTTDWDLLRSKCRFWISNNYYYYFAEWQYKNIKPCIIVEKLLMGNNGEIPNNYRIHCMNGNAEIISVNIYQGNNRNYTSGKYNKNWDYLDFRFGTEDPPKEIIKITPPLNLERMLFIAEDIAKEFQYVRVDFYEVDGKLYYGEITFHDSGGYDKLIPFEWDIKFGKKFSIKA